MEYKLIGSEMLIRIKSILIPVVVICLSLSIWACNPMYFVAEPDKDDKVKTLYKFEDTYIVQKEDLLFEMLVVGDSDTKFYCLVANLSNNEYKLVPKKIMFISGGNSLALTDDPFNRSENIFFDEKWGADYVDDKPNRLKEIIINPSEVRIFGFQFSPTRVDTDSTFSMDQFRVIMELMNMENQDTEEFKFHFRKRD